MRIVLLTGMALLTAATWAHTPPAKTGSGHSAQPGHRETAPTSSIKPSAVIPYGNQESQRVELYLPEGPGPFPVVAFIHGGCYQSNRPSLEEIRPAFAQIARAGIAVWGIEYRRVDEPGGPYPGMFQDIAAATDLLVREAGHYRLDLSRAVVAGHSAGGP